MTLVSYREERKMKKLLAWGLLPVLLLGLAPGAQAAVIGPALNNTFTGNDTAGERINLDESNPLVLGPGTYTATLFSFFAVQTSTKTTPFLAINADAGTPNPAGDVNAFSIIAAGSTIPTGPTPVTNIVQTVLFGGGAGATFTLAQTTKVFAGVASGSADGSDGNSMGFIAGTQVDHNNPGATQFTPTAGGSLPSFTNPNLGRIYGFNVTVDAPEPGTLSLVVLAATAFLRRRR
jgi:hypothetical protein